MTYKKSTYSPPRDPRFCVEVDIRKNVIHVRNTRRKDVALEFTPEEWKAFVLGVKNNEFEPEDSQ